ncbi:MAG: hypothetical protein LKJ21_01600 [Oscillospiraceae bacterium]|jgi:hypothetical protein|nr:hypothetical protein [Oscillospiraceae bacterium]MCI1991370.1 hypothetical protein [Oscillospiraceae bacterium]MCI2034661.1 hypothetical protein [Oscillospiraceae bacterium]
MENKKRKEFPPDLDKVQKTLGVAWQEPPKKGTPDDSIKTEHPKAKGPTL